MCNWSDEGSTSLAIFPSVFLSFCFIITYCQQSKLEDCLCWQQWIKDLHFMACHRFAPSGIKLLHPTGLSPYNSVSIYCALIWNAHDSHEERIIFPIKESDSRCQFKESSHKVGSLWDGASCISTNIHYLLNLISCCFFWFYHKYNFQVFKLSPLLLEFLFPIL